MLTASESAELSLLLLPAPLYRKAGDGVHSDLDLLYRRVPLHGKQIVAHLGQTGGVGPDIHLLRLRDDRAIEHILDRIVPHILKKRRVGSDYVGVRILDEIGL